MAHLMTERDGAVFHGEAAWHGLGTVVTEAPSPAEALRIAGLEWQVETCAVEAVRLTGAVGVGPNGEVVAGQTRIAADAFRANVRGDTGEVLGIVGDGYHVVQNADLVGLIYAAAQSEGVKVETLGSFKGGRVIYACAMLNTFNLDERDRLYTYGLFTNAHDGSGALRVMPTSVRVVCANTHAAAVGGAEGRRLVVTLRHSSGLAERLPEVRACLRGAIAYAAFFREQAERLAARRMTEAEVQRFMLDVYQRLNGPIPSESEATDRGTRTRRTKALEAIASWVDNLREEQQVMGKADPTAWHVANAVTTWIDHDRTSRGDRAYTNLLGKASDDKAAVFQAAEALAAAGPV